MGYFGLTPVNDGSDRAKSTARLPSERRAAGLRCWRLAAAIIYAYDAPGDAFWIADSEAVVASKLLCRPGVKNQLIGQLRG